MKFSSLTRRVGGKGADAWDVHYAALERQLRGEDTIILSIGQEMLETTPEIIIESAVDSLKKGRHHYSEISGEPQIRDAIAHSFTRQSGVPVTAANCAVFSGAQNALFAASLCTLEKGDEAIIIEPYYATYPATFSVAGAEIVTVQTKPANDFIPSVDDVLSKVTGRTRAIVINSPHNPSGMIYDAQLIAAIVDVCKKNDIWLISDEVYGSLLANGELTSPASISGAFDYCITVSSVSKSHRMTGWRLGWIVAPQTLINHLFNLSMCMSYGLPQFIQDAAVTALQNSDEISATVRADIDRKRNLVLSLLNKIPCIAVRGSRVGMFVTFDISELDISATDFAWRLLDAYGVAVLPCSAFGSSGRGVLRMNIGENEENLKTACKNIHKLCSSL